MRIIQPARKRNRDSRLTDSDQSRSDQAGSAYANSDYLDSKHPETKKSTYRETDVGTGTTGKDANTMPVSKSSDFIMESDDIFFQQERRTKRGSHSRNANVRNTSRGQAAKHSSQTDQSIEDSVELSQSKKEFNSLLGKGVHLLSMREHSTKEMTDKLMAKSDSADIVYAVLDQLRSNNYLSDERFTESYVRSRANKGFGPIKIRSELSGKGIANDLIAEYLDLGSARWFDNATQQYHKKYGDDPVSDYNTWTKRARFMQSRGFTSEHIRISLPDVNDE